MLRMHVDIELVGATSLRYQRLSDNVLFQTAIQTLALVPRCLGRGLQAMGIGHFIKSDTDDQSVI